MLISPKTQSQDSLTNSPCTHSSASVIIDLVEFKVSTPNDHQSISLEWTITNSNYMNKYTIERKTPNGKFMAIGTTSMNHFTDNTPMLGTNIYRLSVITPNNKMFHSKSIEQDFTPIEISIGPNPVCDQLILNYTIQGDQPFSIELRNKLGHIIHKSNHLANFEGIGQTTLNVSTYKPDIYFVLITQGKHIVTKMFRVHP